ncbi:MAG: M48 family metallopeptidase [Bacteriovoracaceae bacterium]|nr:M48 family metallopeptidase [Bacteriovoracaceae bacterium]
MQNIKLFLQYGIALLLITNTVSATCSFSLKNAAPKLVENGVPLFVDNKSFKSSTLDKLKYRAAQAQRKYIPSMSACPMTKAHVQVVVDKIFKESNLSFLQKGPNRLETVLLCSKADTPPVARVVAGKYLIVPSSLPLRAKSEDAMAAVLAHEIAHYTLRHHARLIEDLNGRAPSGDRSLLNRIKRQHEVEADLTGLKLMTNAGYNPQATLDHLLEVKTIVDKRRNRRPKGSHPSHGIRATLLQEHIKKCGYELVKNTIISTRRFSDEIKRFLNSKNG